MEGNTRIAPPFPGRTPSAPPPPRPPRSARCRGRSAGTHRWPRSPSGTRAPGGRTSISLSGCCPRRGNAPAASTSNPSPAFLLDGDGERSNLDGSVEVRTTLPMLQEPKSVPLTEQLRSVRTRRVCNPTGYSVTWLKDAVVFAARAQRE